MLFAKVLEFISLHAQGCNLDFKAMAPCSSCCGKSPPSVGKGTQSVKSISKQSFNGCWQRIRGAHNIKFILWPVCQIPSQLLSTSVELKPSLFKMVTGQSCSSSLKLNLNVSCIILDVKLKSFSVRKPVERPEESKAFFLPSPSCSARRARASNSAKL